jgi:peptidoglycan/LPS O-acetylase OafA/YrhL
VVAQQAQQDKGGSLMKRIQLVLAALTLVVTSLAAFAAPAMAQDRNWDNWNNDWNHNWSDSWWNAPWWWNDPFFNDFNGDGFQDFEQDADSGEIVQTFDVS